MTCFIGKTLYIWSSIELNMSSFKRSIIKRLILKPCKTLFIMSDTNTPTKAIKRRVKPKKMVKKKRKKWKKRYCYRGVTWELRNEAEINTGMGDLILSWLSKKGGRWLRPPAKTSVLIPFYRTLSWVLNKLFQPWAGCCAGSRPARNKHSALQVPLELKWFHRCP